MSNTDKKQCQCKNCSNAMGGKKDKSAQCDKKPTCDNK